MPGPSTMTKPPSSTLLKTHHRRRDGLPVEVERDCTIDVGAIDADSRGCQTSEGFVSRQAERIPRSHRNDCKLRACGGHQFGGRGVGAPVMAYLQQGRSWMLDSRHTPLHL